MPEKPEPKISTGEAVTIGLFLAILDVIDFIPFAGDLTDIAAAPLVLYYFMKHINGTAYIVSWVLDLIPVVQEFPSRSVVWWGTVFFDRFAPAKLEAVVEKIGEEAEGGKGGGELEEGTAKGVTAAGETAESQRGAEGGEAAASAEVEGGEQAARHGEEDNEEEGEDSREGSRTNREREERSAEGGRGGEEEGGEQGDHAVDPMALGAEITPEEEQKEELFTMGGLATKAPARPNDDQDSGDPREKVVNMQKYKETRTSENKSSRNGQENVVPFEDIKRKDSRAA